MAEAQRVIPRKEWIPFLDEFTRAHQGQPVRVEVQGRTEAQNLPLQGISADDRGSEHDVNIIVGDERNPGLTHMVPSAVRLLADNSSGDEATLTIESRDGSRTTVKVGVARRAA